MNDTRGMITVEATLVFPVIFLGLLAIIYVGIVHYQNIAVAASAMRSANRISMAWQYIGGDSPKMLSNINESEDMLSKEDFKQRDPYRFILENTSKREKNGEVYAQKLIGEIPRIYTDGTLQNNVKVQKTGNVLLGYIEVSAERNYINPLGKLLEKFGVADRQKNELKAKAVLTSPSEFIRNIDFIEEMAKKIFGK